MCVCVRVCHRAADQRKGRLGDLIFICLTKFTDRGAEVEPRGCFRSTGQREDTEQVTGGAHPDGDGQIHKTADLPPRIPELVSVLIPAIIKPLTDTW